jgi:hypothetical protein
MSRKRLAFLFIALALLACSLPARLVEQTPTPFDGGEIQPPEVVLLARQSLADELGVDPGRITISLIESARWEDSCLELPASGESCDPTEIDGYRVEMTYSGQTFTFHTDLLNAFRRAPQNTWSQPALQAQRLLAGLLGYEPDSIQILSEQPTTFGDSCLGIHIAEIACAQLRTSGMVITLQAGEQQFVFHSALNSREPVLAEAAGYSTSTPTLTWSRQGSRQGLCDDLLLYLNGWGVQYSCIGTTGRTPGVLSLTPAQQRQLLRWALAYRPFDYRQTSVDGIAESMIFFGLGKADPGFEEEKAVAEFAAQVLQPPATQMPTIPQATP